MIRSQNHSENSKIIGSIVFWSIQLTVPREGKVNFQVMFRQSLFRVYAVRCKTMLVSLEKQLNVCRI